MDGIYVAPMPRATARANFFHGELMPRETAGASFFFMDI